MVMTLILPWFPIVLAVGVAGRLLGRPRASFLGVACALFWIALTQASLGVAMWQDGWTVMSLLAGSSAIALMGAWSGQGVAAVWSDRERHEPRRRSLERSSITQNVTVGDSLDRFDEWLSEHRDDTDPWPAFGEFVREVLRGCAGASHVQILRLSGDEQELLALHASDAPAGTERRAARQGIPGHVLTSGRSYVQDDATQGDLVRKLARESGERIAWCFPVTLGVKRLGIVIAGKLAMAPDHIRETLRTAEQLVNLFWRMLSETQQSLSSAQRDPVTRAFTRPSFLCIAESALRDSYRQREPVTLVVVAIEGLRELSDSGRWESADEVSADVARTIRAKLRTDDCMGRFDGSRFALLLRRVDSELASLIVAQLMTRIQDTLTVDRYKGAAIRVRCGLAGSGAERPELRTLVSRALVQARRARKDDVPVASDMPVPQQGTDPGQIAPSASRPDNETSAALPTDNPNAESAAEPAEPVPATTTEADR